MEIKDIKEENKFLKSRIDGIENNLPKMIRELIDYYTEQKITPKLDELLTKSDYKEKSKMKLDHVVFNNWIKDQLQKEATNDREFKIDERLFNIEKNIGKAVSKEELKAQLKNKANNERLIELRENVHKL